MSSEYLDTSEYDAYGVPNATLTQVRLASQLIDAHLARPEGLVWVPDSRGNPSFMLSPNPKFTLTATSPISPGTNVPVTYTGPLLDNNSVGDVLILDRANTGVTEACVIQSVQPPPAQTLVLTTVLNAHDANFAMDAGLVIMEEIELPPDRSIARLSKTPALRLLSGSGRYGYGRRSQQMQGDQQEFNLLAAVQSFGGPPLWIPWSPANASLSFNTGEVWVPAGILLAYFTEVRVWYVAGFSKANLPDNVKQACANIITLGKDSGLGANIRGRTVQGQMMVSKWENNMIDKNTRNMLAPYKARTFV